ncbi:MAG: hypothetical protein NTW54_02685 [Bacteroidetes bacterium]|nr:hypothetical protein [Bacteroidota bacterium]
MQIRFFFLLLMTLFCVASAHSQAASVNLNQTRFFSFSPSLQTNGYGVNFRWGQTSVQSKYSFYIVEFGKIKHPKEFRYVGNTRYNGFVFGRKFVAMPLKLGIGKYAVLGVRNSKNDIGVGWAYQLGASMALLKPVYLFIDEQPGMLGSHEKLVKYNGENDIDLENILGGAPFFNGFNQIKVVPGAFGKLAMVFSWGKYYNEYHSLEIGVLTEVYSQELPLMASTQNSYIYPSFYINFNLGKVW